MTALPPCPTPKSADTGAEPSGAGERWDLGPWENGYRQIWTPSGAPFQATVVAHVFGDDLWRARLIAAAPDLLAALRFDPRHPVERARAAA